MVLRYPEHVPAGIRLAVPVTNSALPATIMELLGEGGQETFPGPPLNALWTAPGGAARTGLMLFLKFRKTQHHLLMRIRRSENWSRPLPTVP